MIYHHVHQNDDFGCAIGAAAMLAHVSYDVAKIAIHQHLISSFDDTRTYDLLRGLKHLGMKTRSYQGITIGQTQTINFVNNLRHDALLTLDEGNDAFGTYEHCVAWCATKKRIYDSYDMSYIPYFHTIHNYFVIRGWRISHVIEITGREVEKTREYTKRVKRQIKTQQ